MLSIKILCFLTLTSLASLLPGKKGKMYLVEVESEKKSANSLPGSKLNARPRMQNKAFPAFPRSPIHDPLEEAIIKKPYMVYRVNNDPLGCIYRSGQKTPSGDCNECVCHVESQAECTNIDCGNTEAIHLCKDCLRLLAESGGYMDWYAKLTSNDCNCLA